jgi:2-C-methyl-D-erythritol 2,4-cyclodiphosphate synthase
MESSTQGLRTKNRQDFPLGVVAHSDGDVVYHSTTDAILGAVGDVETG